MEKNTGGRPPGSPFTVTGSDYGRDSALLGAGLTVEINPSTRAYLDYDGQLTGGFDQHAISAGFRVRF